MRSPQGHLGNYCYSWEEAKLGRGHFMKAGGERTWHTGTEGIPGFQGLAKVFATHAAGMGWGGGGMGGEAG